MMPKLPDLKKLSPSQTIIVLGGLAVALGVGILIYFNLRPSESANQAKLTFWGTENKAAFEGSIEAFQNTNKGVEIQYYQINENNFEDTLVNALAAGTGPDLFMIPNTGLIKHRAKIAAFQPATINLLSFQEQYPQIAEQDFVENGTIYALPLYIDTLALLYNKNLFDQAGLTTIPKTWNAVKQTATTLRAVDGNNQLVKAGAALGGSERTVQNATRILSCMMLQAAATDAQAVQSKSLFGAGSQNAANYYLQFANPVQPFYTWNETWPNSIESFASEKVAMIFGFKNDRARIKDKNPYLAIGVAAFPQQDGANATISCAKYAGIAISKQTQNYAWAQNFALYVATNPDAAYSFAATTGHTPALRSLIANQIQDPQESVFARQTLTSRSWTNPDAAKVSSILNALIINVLSGQVDFASAYTQAQGQINQLLRR